MAAIKKGKGDVLRAKANAVHLQGLVLEVSKGQYKTWESYRDRLKVTQPKAPEKGQIWSTLRKPRHFVGAADHSVGEPRLVLLLDAEGEMLSHRGRHYKKLLIAPVSVDIEMATEWDFILDQENGPLGYECIVEIWNKVTMLDDSLKKCLGVLDPGTMNLIDRLVADYASNAIEGAEVNWSLYGKNIGEGKVEPGNQIYRFQRDETEAVGYLSKPVKALVDLPSVANELQRREMIVIRLKNQLRQTGSAQFQDAFQQIATFGEQV